MSECSPCTGGGAVLNAGMLQRLAKIQQQAFAKLMVVSVGLLMASVLAYATGLGFLVMSTLGAVGLISLILPAIFFMFFIMFSTASETGKVVSDGVCSGADWMDRFLKELYKRMGQHGLVVLLVAIILGVLTVIAMHYVPM